MEEGSNKSTLLAMKGYINSLTPPRDCRTIPGFSGAGQYVLEMTTTRRGCQGQSFICNRIICNYMCMYLYVCSLLMLLRIQYTMSKS